MFLQPADGGHIQADAGGAVAGERVRFRTSTYDTDFTCMNALDELTSALASLPAFSLIDPAAVPARIADIVADNERGIEQMLDAGGPRTWDSVCARLDDFNDRLNRAWSPVRHLHSVADNDALRAAYGEALPMIVNYGTAQMQNDRLCAAYRELLESQAFLITYPKRFRLGWCQICRGPGRSTSAALAREVAVEI